LKSFLKKVGVPFNVCSLLQEWIAQEKEKDENFRHVFFFF